MTLVLRSIAATALMAFSQAALAKLPPPTEEAKLKAAEAAAKADYAGKVAAFQLCRAQDRAAAAYRQKLQADGKTPNPPNEVPPCTDPGGPPSPAAGELEKAGAHSNPAGVSASATGTANRTAEPTGTAASAGVAVVPVQPAPGQKKP